YSADLEFSPSVVFAAVEASVIEPLRSVQQLLDRRPYATRLYSTLSAADMTLDPVFTWNPDLADVSNQHNAERVIECNPSVDISAANWRIELPQGGVVRGRAQDVGTWPTAVDEQPPNLRVLQLGTTGAGAVLADNRAEIEAQLGAYNDSVMSDDPTTGSMMPGLGGDVRTLSNDSCAIGAPFAASRRTGWAGAALLLSMLGLGWRRRARLTSSRSVRRASPPAE
ncbi:MAG TPA: hypothetical protein VMG12_14315, partial [Polyangiaceae bacterium]|nr:hypothetical protein [Polyangiaceae bacterium]